MEKKLTLAHGGGGEETQKLIKELFIKLFKNPILERMEDSALLEVKGKDSLHYRRFHGKTLLLQGG